ncbi:MAG: hypothetical protein ABI612_06220 [Betaproteobacteria bacterium]
MRWTYYFPRENPQEDEQRESTLRLIDRWWQSFTAKTSELEQWLNNTSDWDLSGWMQENLQNIDRRLMWEFGPGHSGGHRLVITPETAQHLRPLAHEILSRAPVLPGWTFLQFRVAESVEQMRESVRTRSGGEVAFTDIALKPGELNRVDLAFQFPQTFLDRERARAHDQAFIAAEALLGEDMLSDWLGKLDALSEVEQALPPGAIPRAFTAQVAKQRAGIAPQPFLDRLPTLTWTGIDLQPRQADDYAHRFDLLTAMTGAVDLWRNAHSDQTFWSGRYSRSGETFCYLKIDRGAPAQASEVESRGALEGAINTALVQRRLGCGIGGGVGLRYNYVDLALLDVYAAAPVIAEVVQQTVGADTLAWLQFFDTTLSEEWIAVGTSKQPPPMGSLI